MGDRLGHVRESLVLAGACWPRARALLRWIAWGAVATAVVAALILLPPLIAPELSDPQAQFEVRDRARLTVATIVGGLILLVGVWMNWRRVGALEKQVATAQLGQITERFTRAIDQLGAVRSDNAVAPEIRAGGVRSLERIARESEEDFWPILDILSAYVRSVSPTPDDDHWDALADRAYEVRYRMDVAFAIEAITRLWPTEGAANHRPLDLVGAFVPRIVLAGRHLQGAELRHAHLEYADLTGGDLEGARLGGANLEHAVLQGANLRAADLAGARLSDADLSAAKLQDSYLAAVDAGSANLRGANLQGANLQVARLRGADLRDADLRNADLLAADLQGANLEGAKHGARTRWPDGFGPTVAPERSG